jgi:hypothetical protein
VWGEEEMEEDMEKGRSLETEDRRVWEGRNLDRVEETLDSGEVENDGGTCA